MDPIELLTTGYGKIGGWLQDLGRFLLSPRKYLLQSDQETSEEVIKRLAFYGCSFAFIELAIFGLVLRWASTPTVASVAAVSLFETAIGLIYVPAFLISAYSARLRNPVRTSIAYALTFRFMYLLPPLILYGLFLISEDYSFALLRGIATYLFIIGSFVMFPLAVARTLKQRAFMLILTLVAAYAIMVVLENLPGFSGLSSSDRGSSMSMMYDPIGAEIDLITELVPERKITRSVDEVLEQVDKMISRQVADTLSSGKLEPLEVRWFRERWPLLSAPVRQNLTEQEKQLSSALDAAHFATTQRHLRYAVAETRAGLTVLRAVDVIAKDPGYRTYLDYEKARSAMYRANIEHATFEGDHLSVRVRLMRMKLLHT
jgi:hypothetical protein